MRFAVLGLAALLILPAALAVDHAELASVWDRSAPGKAPAGPGTPESWLEEVSKPKEAGAPSAKFKKTGRFLSAERNGKLYLANAEAGLIIAGWNAGQPAVESLYHFATGTEWLSGKKGPLWEIAWKSPDVRWTNADLPAPRCELAFDERSATIKFLWPAAKIGRSEGTASVSASIELPAADSVPRYRISVRNESKDAGIWSVRFPILHGVGLRGEVDAVAGTLGTSRLVRRFAGEIRDHLFGEQLRVLTQGDCSLYVSTEDPANWQKYYRYKAGAELDIMVLPEDTAQPGKSYEQPFPILIGPIAGDWFDASQRYRTWALQQKWMAKGPVETWTGAARKMSETMLWLQTLSPQANDVAKQVQALVDLHARLGVASGVHYYQWWAKDAFSPTVLTSGFKSGLPQGWDPLRKAGMEILPYFNVLYWKAGWRGENKETVWPDVKQVDPGFAEARAAACRPYPGVAGDDSADEKFDIYDDYYIVNGGNNVMVPMCRETKLWQDHLVALAKLMEENGNDLVYLDQGGVPPRSPCFDPSHGHKLGGGGQWADGTRRMIERIKYDTGKELAICCEGAYEGYLDLVENQFMHYWPWLAKKDALCPLFEAIYHDHTLFMGAVKPHPDATAYAIDVGTRLLHGNQFRAEARMFDDPKYTDQSAFITRMAKLRAVGAPFLVAGSMVRPPDWRSAPSRVRADWLLKKGELLQTIGYPGMERSAYKLRDGSEAVFVVNFSDQPAEASLDLQKWAAGNSCVVTDSDGTKTEAAAGAPIKIGARNGIMITKSK